MLGSNSTDYNKALVHFLEARKNNPLDDELPILFGNCYFFQNRFNEAILELRSALDIEPQNFDALYLLAGSYFKLGQYETAKDEYQKGAWVNNPKQESFLGGIVECYVMTNQIDKAKELLIKYLSNEPNNEAAHYFLGLVYEIDKDIQNAQNEYKIANAFGFGK